MPYSVPVAVLCLALATVYAFEANRRANKGRTIMCFIFPVVLALFVGSAWYDWHSSSGNSATQYMIAFWCWCATCLMTLIALARRLWWLRTNRHESR